MKTVFLLSVLCGCRTPSVTISSEDPILDGAVDTAVEVASEDILCTGLAAEQGSGVALSRQEGSRVEWMTLSGEQGAFDFSPPDNIDTFRFKTLRTGGHMAVVGSGYDRSIFEDEARLEGRTALRLFDAFGMLLAEQDLDGFSTAMYLGEDGTVAYTPGRVDPDVVRDGRILTPTGERMVLSGWYPVGTPENGSVPVCATQDAADCGVYDLLTGAISATDPETDEIVLLGDTLTFDTTTLTLPAADAHEIADMRDGYLLIASERDGLWAPSLQVDLESGVSWTLTLPDGQGPQDLGHCSGPVGQLGADGTVVVPLWDGEQTAIWQTDGTDWQVIGQPASSWLDLGAVGDTVLGVGIGDVGLTFCPKWAGGSDDALQPGDVEIIHQGTRTVVPGGVAGILAVPGGDHSGMLSGEGACVLVFGGTELIDLQTGAVRDLGADWDWL